MKTPFLDLAKKRSSIRSYKDTPVEYEKLLRCLEAARLAPSACNSQPWQFEVITDQSLCLAIAAQTHLSFSGLNKFTAKVPVFVAIVLRAQKLTAKAGGILKGKPFYFMDIGIAAEHFCLQAAEEDLGTCIIGWFHEKKVRKLLHTSRKRIPLLIACGYPEKKSASTPKKRLPLEDITNYHTGE